jgi:hypothetical protein
MAESMVALGVLAMAFSKAVRTEVYRRQHGRCGICGIHLPRLQTHHRYPHSRQKEYGLSDEFIDSIENSIGLCSQCHLVADREALKMGIILPQVHGDIQDDVQKDIYHDEKHE